MPYSEQLIARSCIVKSCLAPPVAHDWRGYTKFRDDTTSPSFDYDEDSFTEGKEIWFCSEHAKDFLWPLIEQATGYTTAQVLADFKQDGMM